MEVAVTHILRVFAFCLASLGLGLILDGYGVFTPAHPQALATVVAARIPVRSGPGLRIEVVDTLVPALPLGSVLNPCLPTPVFDLALARPSLVLG